MSREFGKEQRTPASLNAELHGLRAQLPQRLQRSDIPDASTLDRGIDSSPRPVVEVELLPEFFNAFPSDEQQQDAMRDLASDLRFVLQDFRDRKRRARSELPNLLINKFKALIAKSSATDSAKGFAVKCFRDDIQGGIDKDDPTSGQSSWVFSGDPSDEGIFVAANSMAMERVGYKKYKAGYEEDRQLLEILKQNNPELVVASINAVTSGMTSKEARLQQWQREFQEKYGEAIE